MTLFGAQLSPSARAKNAISHKGNGSEARSSDFSGLRMRDGEYLTMAYFKFDKMFCFRYMCVVSCMISAGRVCPPWITRPLLVKRLQLTGPP